MSQIEIIGVVVAVVFTVGAGIGLQVWDARMTEARLEAAENKDEPDGEPAADSGDSSNRSRPRRKHGR